MLDLPPRMLFLPTKRVVEDEKVVQVKKVDKKERWVWMLKSRLWGRQIDLER
jgi:hypothetical protein